MREDLPLGEYELNVKRAPQPREEVDMSGCINPAETLIKLLNKKRSLTSSKSRYLKDGKVSRAENEMGKIEIINSQIAQVRAQLSGQTNLLK